MENSNKPPTLHIEIDSFPSNQDLSGLMALAWPQNTGNDKPVVQYDVSLRRCLGHVTANLDGEIIGFAKMASDGDAHAFLLDPTVHPDHRNRGIGKSLVAALVELARQRGAQFVHVDFEPHLTHFYQECGFSPTAAGLLRL